MRAQDWLGTGPLAVMGVSRGGELALLLGATFPEIDAVVAYVPSGVVHGAFGPSKPGDTRARAAWTHRGSPLPFLQQGNRSGDAGAVGWRGSARVETPLYLALLRDTAAVERATIPVERTRGPILMISGKDDTMWPSFDLAELARRRLERCSRSSPRCGGRPRRLRAARERPSVPAID
jgi:pimeloyl-ACP methyl ester carboxylesterase